MTIVYRVGGGLYVNLTNRCPCACTFCIRKKAPGAYGADSLWLSREPRPDEVLAAIEKEIPGGADEIVFCGYGEPTERLDALLAVARGVKRAHPQIPIRVNTNGLCDLIAGRPVAAEFKDLVDSLSISLNASSSKEYYKLCRPKFGPESYDAVLRFARDAVQYVPNVVMTIVQTEQCTAEKIEQCREICERIGAKLRVRPLI